MASYREIHLYVKQKYDFVPGTCWIARAKEKYGLRLRQAPNRTDPEIRVKPCPEDKFPAILMDSPGSGFFFLGSAVVGPAPGYFYGGLWKRGFNGMAFSGAPSNA